MEQTAKPPAYSELSKDPEVMSQFDKAEEHTMQISYKNWIGTSAKVTDPASTSTLYNIDFKLRRPQLLFKMLNSETPFATASLYAWKSSIDLQVHGHALKLKPPSCLSCTYTYVSPAFENTTLSWVGKVGFRTVEYVCLDAQQMPVAKFTARCWSLKMGHLEFAGAALDSEVARDEIMATGMAIAYYMLVVLPTSGIAAIA